MAYARARVWQTAEGKQLQRMFDSYFSEGGLHRVLDAGAGYELPLDIPLDAHLIALDTSEAALAKNENADERIVGDLQKYKFPDNHFDAIICWWVLEHVPRRREALSSMAAALRPGGLLVIAIPNLWSMKAIVTRLTPYRFHVWFARRSNPAAGTPGTSPYPTFLRRDLSPRNLSRAAAAFGLRPFYSSIYSAEPEARLPEPLRLIWKGIGSVVRAATFGRYDPLSSEYLVVFQKS
jgi:SAM-dependent methyltransferase